MKEDCYYLKCLLLIPQSGSLILELNSEPGVFVKTKLLIIPRMD